MMNDGRVTTWHAGILNTMTDTDGERFTVDDLQQMIKDVDRVPVTVEFKYDIGEAIDFLVTDGQEITCQMLLKADIPIGAVPVVSFRHEGVVDGQYQNLCLLSIGLTMQPATLGTWIRRTDSTMETQNVTSVT